MSNELSITVNNTVYELSDEFKQDVEDLAESFYDGNDFIELCWREAAANEAEGHMEGDPILCIETSGHVVPWENLSEFTVDEGDDIVDAEDIPDIKEMVVPEEYRNIPDPDDDDIDTWIPEPEKYNESDGPVLAFPAPEDTRAERWETGRSLTKLYTIVEWNLQLRADTAYTVYENSNANSHDDWELWLESTNCTAVAEKEKSSSDPYGDVEDMGPKYGKNSNNWRF